MDSRIFSIDQLTERETEILIRIANGSSDQAIADELYLSLNTVKWYNRKIYEKLSVNSRTQAIARARELHLFDQEPDPKYPEPASVPARKYHLPAEVNSFIGRRWEGSEVERLLQKNRLVTLVGPPGSGKTRLSLNIAQRVADQFKDGVYFIPLSPVVSTGDILWAIAEHLDFQFRIERRAFGAAAQVSGRKGALAGNR